MTGFQLYVNTLIILVPALTACACIALMAFSRRNCLTAKERILKSIHILYLLMTFLSWFTVFCYIFFPKVFVVLNIPCLAGFILTPVFFFRVIRFMTRVELEEQFPSLHYLVPALIGAVFLVWSLCVPFDVQEAIVKSRDLSVAGEYALYSRLFTSKPLLRFIFTLVYYCFIARLLVRYYRKASHSDSLARKPARWVIFLIILSLILAFSSVMSVIMPRSSIVTSIYTAIAALSISAQYMLLTFLIIRRKYLLYALHVEPVIIDKSTVGNDKHGENIMIGEIEEIAGQKDGRRSFAGKLTRNQLNTYFRKQKPYLQADFKITDLVEGMDVNRSVLSAFINQNYGVNFNRFVNQWRLRELERLISLPSNKGKSIAKLSAKAGFAELRQYYRAIAAEK